MTTSIETPRILDSVFQILFHLFSSRSFSLFILFYCNRVCMDVAVLLYENLFTSMWYTNSIGIHKLCIFRTLCRSQSVYAYGEFVCAWAHFKIEFIVNCNECVTINYFASLYMYKTIFVAQFSQQTTTGSIKNDGRRQKIKKI